MRTQAFAFLLAPLLASAAPMKRAAAASDLLVLKFANVLEQLETEFYSQALQKFQVSDFTSAGFADAQVPIQQFTAIQSDESTHTSVLASTLTSLGDAALTGCSFDFSSVLTDVATMAKVARLVEYVGVGAYLGAAHLVQDPVLLTAAASIVTVEARHQSILNVLNSGTAIPQAFDIPLLPQEVLALAGGFISGCDVGISALPSLSVTNTGSVQQGDSLSFSSSAISSSLDTSTLTCQMMAGGMPFSLAQPFTSCIVPGNITGPVAIWVTNDTQPLNNNARDQFLGNIVAGPTMVFLDNKPEQLSSAAITGSFSDGSSSNSGSSSDSSSSGSSSADSSTATASSGVSVTTSTISVAEASAIVASASSASAAATATAASAQDNSGETPGSANFATGPSPDGHTNVLGWTNVPAS